MKSARKILHIPQSQVIAPEFLDIPTPKMGGKAWVMERPGLFVLERGEGVMRTLACTSFGAGNIDIYDGVPEENGYFPHPSSPEEDPAYHGRLIYTAHPAVMGSWMLDAGFIHGLTLAVAGGHNDIAPIGTLVWMPRAR